MFLSSISIYAIIASGSVISILVPYYFMKKKKTSVEVPPNPEPEQNCETANDELPVINVSNELSVINVSNELSVINWHNILYSETPYLQPITCDSDNWEIVGEVKNLYIYPIEGGGKFSVNEMYCSNNGCFIKINGAAFPLRDRSFVVYSVTPYTNQKKAILKDLNLSVISIKQSDSVITFSSPDTYLEVSIDINKVFTSDTTKVNYGDGTIINVTDCGDEISTFITAVIKNPSEKLPRALRLGFYISDPRGLKYHNNGLTLETQEERTLHFTKSFLPNYSACTLVNEASVTALREEITNNSMYKSELTHDFFRPHIVISGRLQRYNEDKIKAIKIGKTQFTNKLPCIHDKQVNINPATGNLTLDEQPYNTLMSIRPLTKIYPTGDELVATFGINMKVFHEGEIKVGHIVHVQWNNSE